MKNLFCYVVLILINTAIFAQGWSGMNFGSPYVNRLYWNIEDDNIEAVKEYLNDGWDIESRHGLLDVNILSYAASSGSYEVVKYLIGRGADVNALSDNGNLTPIMHAIPFPGAPEEYNTKKAKVFLSLLKNPKVNIYFKNQSGLDILEVVQTFKNEELVKAVKTELRKRKKY